MRITSNVADVIRQVRAYRDNLDNLLAEVIKRLVDEGAVIARTEVVHLDAVYTGKLANSIDHFYDEATHTGFVRCNADYGVFVEFGTGIVGKTHPYGGTAMAAAGYRYGGGTTYVQLSDGRVGWYFPTDDGTFVFTEGQPSRPFMWNTAQMMKKQVIPIARQVFKNA